PQAAQSAAPRRCGSACAARRDCCGGDVVPFPACWRAGGGGVWWKPHPLGGYRRGVGVVNSLSSDATLSLCPAGTQAVTPRGSGLVAAAAARAGAAAVLASVVDPFGRTAIGMTARLNGVSGTQVVADLLSREPPRDTVVVAGEVWYERVMTERLLTLLDAARE